MTSSVISTLPRPPPTFDMCSSPQVIFSTGSCNRELTSTGRRRVSSARSAVRAAAFADRTEANVATARTSVPPAVANDDTVAQSVTSHQPPVDRPPGQLVAVRQLQLAQHRGDVRLDRLRRYVQLARDLLVGVAARDQTEDLALARGELVELGIDRADRD